jgi:DNA topoisomerase I
MKLVIVESPAKARTIEKFLGPDFRVEASYGHIRDLPSSAAEVPPTLRKKSWAKLGVDTENGFAPLYVVPKDSQKRVAELKKMLGKADEVLLATDEDREGESISWHLLEVLSPKVPVHRITFHEITRPAIQEALAHPRQVDDKLVRAQETRRILDRLYGYSLSPVLWKKVRTKLSAGRVQSVALRLVVEREEERQAFQSTEFWDVAARGAPHRQE